MNVDVVVMVVALKVHSVGCGLGRVSPLGSGCEKDTQTHTHTHTRVPSHSVESDTMWSPVATVEKGWPHVWSSCIVWRGSAL